jgi:hypothetical protein
MNDALPIRLTESQLAKFTAILGSAPVLSTENAEHYNQIWDHLLKCFLPCDFMEFFLIRQVQEAIWVILRYSRHRTVAIDRRFRESLEFQLKRKQMQKARREALANEIAEKSGRPVSELRRLIDLEVTAVAAVQEADEILERAPSEIDHNRALEAGIKFQTQLDQLINTAHERHESAMRQLELYRHGLGPYLRRISEEIIDLATLQTQELSDKMGLPLIAAPGRENFEAIMSLNKSLASANDPTQEVATSSAESLPVRAPDPETE